MLSAILVSGSVFAQTTVAPVKGTPVKATLKPANRKIKDPNVGIFRAPIPPANEHYKPTPANKSTAPALTQSRAPVKASTPLPVITSSQAKMTRAMATPVKTAKPKVTTATTHSKYTGKKISGVKPVPRIAKSTAIKSKPKTLKPVAKKAQDNNGKMFSTIYHHQ